MGRIVEMHDNVITDTEKQILDDLGDEALTRFHAALWRLYRWEWAGEKDRTITHISRESTPYSLFFSHEDTKHPDLPSSVGGLIYDANHGEWHRHT